MEAQQQGSDRVTRLETYEAFAAAFESAVGAAESESGRVSLVLVDIDWFKRLNDEHGMAAGDHVLALLARHLQAAFEGAGQVYRYGGDSFAALLADTEKEDAFLMMEQARQGFVGDHSVPCEGGEKTLALALSAGVATFPDDGNNVQAVLRKTNEAMYRAKVSGRNKVCLAREEKMVTKTTHYTQGQLEGLSRLSKREDIGEAVLLREALDDLLRKYNA